RQSVICTHPQSVWAPGEHAIHRSRWHSLRGPIPSGKATISLDFGDASFGQTDPELTIFIARGRPDCARRPSGEGGQLVHFLIYDPQHPFTADDQRSFAIFLY